MTAILRKALDLLDRGERVVIATVIEKQGSAPRKVGAKMLVAGNGESHGTLGGGDLERVVIEEARKMIGEDIKLKTNKYILRSGEGLNMVCGGEVKVLFERETPVPTLLIIGAGHIAKPVARMGGMLGFKVVVMDPNPKRADFPEATQFVPERVEKGLSKVKVTRDTYLVICSGDHEYDEVALRKLIGFDTAYKGLLASRSKAKFIFNNMIKDGVPEEHVRHVHAPIGLDIGAETPEEIAVSIMAEIIEIRRGAKRKE